jgi:hypothetical protein
MSQDREIDQVNAFYEKHLNDMRKKHSKVFQTRFDLRYPQDGSVEHGPKQIRDFNEYMKRDLERNNPLPQEGKKRSPGKTETDKHKVDPRIISVREQKDSPNPHYHCSALVNGNAKQSTQDIHKRAERQWGNALGTKNVDGLVDYCDDQGPPSVMIDKSKDDCEIAVKDAKRQASYLAKGRDKEKNPSRFWKATGSRPPKDTVENFKQILDSHEEHDSEE